MQNFHMGFWKILQTFWCLIYIVCGTCQLLAGLFIWITLVEAFLSTFLIVVASLNLLVGFGGVILTHGPFTKRRREVMLYIASCLLAVNFLNVLLTEWFFRVGSNQVVSISTSTSGTQWQDSISNFVWSTTRIFNGIITMVIFLNTQCSFWSITTWKKSSNIKTSVDSYEQISDIERVVSKAKSPKANSKNSRPTWVFEGQNSVDSVSSFSPEPLIADEKPPRTETPPKRPASAVVVRITENPISKAAEPLVDHDKNSNQDRGLCCMTSFSTSTSPILPTKRSLTAMATNDYTNHNHIATDNDENVKHQQPPFKSVSRNSITSISSEGKMQYASIINELEHTIASKKDADIIDKEKPSETNITDNDFTEELEAALQLIQDLDSPNSIVLPPGDSEAPLPDNSSLKL